MGDDSLKRPLTFTASMFHACMLDFIVAFHFFHTIVVDLNILLRLSTVTDSVCLSSAFTKVN